jgi:hypothetical protein
MSITGSTHSLCSCVTNYLTSSIHVIIRYKTIIIAVHQGGGDHKICGGAIAGNRNVPNNRQAQQRFDIRVVRLGFERIPEKDKKIDLTVGYPGADLSYGGLKVHD